AVTSSPSAVIETNFLKAHSAGRHLRINPIFIGCSYLATALILCMSPLTAFAQSERRNIVRVFMDNFGWGELGTYTGLAFRDIHIRKGAGNMRADPLSLASSAVLVLCPNLGRTYTFHCRRQSKRASK